MNTHPILALLFAVSFSGVTATAMAEQVKQTDQVVAVDAKLMQKKQEIDAIEQDHHQAYSQHKTLQQELARLTREHEDLIAKQERAKRGLDKQYGLLLEDPDTDLISFQKKYQSAWAAVKANQNLKLSNKQNIIESKSRLSTLKHQQARLNSECTNLQETRVEARVKRFQAELRESAVLETRYTTSCSSTMTLGECIAQGKYLTKQKAVNIFKNQLLSSLTESNIAKQNLNGVQLNIYVQESQTLESGFSGDGAYSSKIQAQLQAKPSVTAACQLLNVSNRYCLRDTASKSDDNKNKKGWMQVLVRSDQYDDNVTINGVNYGSTPVDIMMPKGSHQITVTKPGFQSYNRKIYVQGTDTVWVKLVPNKQS